MAEGDFFEEEEEEAGDIMVSNESLEPLGVLGEREPLGEVKFPQNFLSMV